MTTRSMFVWALLGVLAGCGREDPNQRPTPAALVLAEVRRIPPFAHGGELALVGVHSHYGGLDAELPSATKRPLHLAVSGAPEAWIDLYEEGLEPREAEVVEGAVIFRNAETDTDLVHFVASGGGAEEVRVLRSSRAPQVVRYRMVGGTAIAGIHAVNGALRAVDREGRVRLETAPIWAVDVHGAAVDVELRCDGASVCDLLLDTFGATFPIFVDPVWTTPPLMPMETPRRLHIAVMTKGLVLVAGGDDKATDGAVSSAQLFDPTVATTTTGWSPTGNMQMARDAFSATALGDGRVLVFGGVKGSTVLSAPEMYDTNAFKMLPSSPPSADARSHHTATLIGDDFVIFAGGTGASGGALPTVFRWQSGNVWTDLHQMNTGRDCHDAAPTTIDKIPTVLVAGGVCSPTAGTAISGSEYYDVAGDMWTQGPDMNARRSYLTLTALSNGDVLAAGGSDESNNGIGSVEVFDSASPAWHLANGLMTTGRGAHIAVRFDGPPNRDRVLIAGGTAHVHGTTTGESTVGMADAFLWERVSGGYGTIHSVAQKMNQGRFFAAATLLPDNRVLVTGGQSDVGPGKELDSIEVFSLDPDGTTCTVANAYECSSSWCVGGLCCHDECACPGSSTVFGDCTGGTCNLSSCPGGDAGDAGSAGGDSGSDANIDSAIADTADSSTGDSTADSSLEDSDTSIDAAIDSGPASFAPDAGGCGCTIPSNAHAPRAFSLIALAAITIFARRRRAHRPSSP